MFPGGSASGLVAASFLCRQVSLRGSADWSASSTRALSGPRRWVSPDWAPCQCRDQLSFNAESLDRKYLPPTRVRQLQQLQVKSDHEKGTSIHRVFIVNVAEPVVHRSTASLCHVHCANQSLIGGSDSAMQCRELPPS
eukprot:6483074-Amphidinium_carterae.1